MVVVLHAHRGPVPPRHGLQGRTKKSKNQNL